MSKEKKGLSLGTKILGAVALGLFVILAIVVGTYEANEKEEVEEVVEDKGLPVTDFNADELVNKAILFIDEDEELVEAEKILTELSNTYKLPIEKVYFDEKVETFVSEQEEKVGTHYPIVAELGSQLLTKEVNGEVTIDEGLNQIVLNLLSKMQYEEDASKEIKELAKQTGVSEKDITSYLENRLELATVKIERPIYKEEGPVLVMFNENQEFGRINALEQETASLHWLLISKGLLNLSQEETGKEALAQLEKGEGELVVSFGTSTCPFCKNTTPIMEKIADAENVPFTYVDIDASVNIADVNKMVKNHMSSFIESTPTVVYFKDGKEISRFVGQQDYFTMDKFIRDNRAALEQQEVENTEEVSDEKEETTESTPVEKEEPTSEKDKKE